MSTLEQCEAEVGGHDLQIWGHRITRGGKKVYVKPLPVTAFWTPNLQEPLDGSSFTAENVGQWVFSRESVHEIPEVSAGHGKVSKIQVQGMLRPAFEVVFPEKKRSLEPDPNDRANPACLFTTKKIAIRS